MAYTFQRTATLSTAVIILLNSMVLSLLPLQTAKASSAYDHLITNATSVGAAFNFDLHKPFAGVTGHTNDRCHDTDYKDMFNWGWITRLKENRDRWPDNPTKTDLTNFIDMIESEDGGYGVIRNSDENTTNYGYISTTVVAWTGTANLNWTTDSVTINAGSNNLRHWTLAPACAIFDTSDPLPTSSLGIETRPSSGQLRIDNVVNVGGSIGNLSGIQNRRSIYFLSGSINMNYPENYDGAIISTRAPTPSGTRHYTSSVVLENSKIKSKADYGPFVFDPTIRKCVLMKHKLYGFSGSTYTNDVEADEWEYITDKTAENHGLVEFELTDEQIAHEFFLLEIDLYRKTDDIDCNSNSITEYMEEIQRVNRPTIYRYMQDPSTSNFFDDKGTNATCTNREINNVPYYFCDTITEDNYIKDCSEYGWIDGFQRIGCELNNLWVRFKNFMKWLFIPKPDTFSGNMNLLKERVTKDDESLIMYPISATVEMTHALVSASGDCTLNTGNIWGKNTNWDLCVLQSKWSAAWTLATTVVRMMYVLSLIHIIYIIYLRLWSYGQ